jgi:hypothetical protein
MRTTLRRAVESISFQKGELFSDLIDQIEVIRFNTKLAFMEPSKFFDDEKVTALSKIIQKHTNLDIVIIDDAGNGPAIFVPQLTANHIFNNKEMAQWAQDNIPGFNLQEHSETVLKMLNKPVIQGEIDLVKAKVCGAFEKMRTTMLMPQTLLAKGSQFTPGEAAAVILHELGHTFTFMEFVGRTLTTNQAIAGLSRFLDKSVDQGKRVVLFARAADELKMDAARKEALKECKTPEQLSTILLDQTIAKSISELGRSIYDVNTAEYLADQFAARQGASVELVTALDKLMSMGSPLWLKAILFIQFLPFIISVIQAGFILIFPIFGLILVALIVYGQDKANEIYDNAAARFIRIKHQLVQQLKNKAIKDDDRKRLVQDVDNIDKIIDDKGYIDKLDIYATIAYYLKPGFRAAHRQELMQKELERIANSDLFVLAAKLKMV